MIAVRAIPGAGKNFIATLISKHYHSNDFMYYDENSNEYFHSPHLTIAKNGKIKTPFWHNNKWKIISTEENESKILMHEHEWCYDPGVNRFKFYKQSSGKVGIDVDKFLNIINEGYYIFTNDQKTDDFIKKLIYIKSNYSRPPIIFDDNSSILQKNIDALNLRLFTVACLNSSRTIDTMKIINKVMGIKEWLKIWQKYCIFLKQFPYIAPMSPFSQYHIIKWVTEKKKWNLCDENIFLLNLELYKKSNINQLDKSENLEKIKELQKKTNMILYEINYKDLFFDLKPTGTILDNYMNEIRTYTERNRKLIDDYESFYGKIL